jgi:hypothetical protein
MAKPKAISVTTKVTLEQFEEIAVKAGPKPISVWVRDTLEATLAREPFEEQIARRLDAILYRLELIERFVLNVGADLSSDTKIDRERVRQYRDGAS